VGLLDALFGKKRLKGATLDKLFALSAARISIEAELGLRPAGAGAVVFKPLSAGEFARAENEIQQLLEAAAAEAGSKLERRTDQYGFEWVIVRDPDFEDVVTSTHVVSSELVARGFGEQLLAAAFPFEGGEHPVYLIYGYKRAAFWPFVPTGNGQERDNAEELRLKAELEQELPIEQDLTRWLALFDAPV
jgi:hypothetical protein